MSPSRIILAVHGVRSVGEWADELEARLQADASFTGCLFESLDYPRLSAVLGWLSTWIRWARHHHTGWMLRKLQDYQRRYPRVPIDIVAHSFGTHIVYHALRLSLDRPPAVFIRKLILVGAVLKTAEPFGIVSGGLIQQVYIHWSHNDSVVLSAPPPFGHLGAHGSAITMPQIHNSKDWQLGHGGYWTSEVFFHTLIDQLRS